MRDLASNVAPKRAIDPQYSAGNDAMVSEIIDRQGYDSLTFLIATTSIADANVTFTALLEESDDSGFSSSNAVADADMVGTEALALFQYDDDNECRKLGYIGSKRYVRLTITPAGNSSPGNYVAAIALLGHPQQAPTANPPA